MAKELTSKLALELKGKGKSPKEIGEEFELSAQKVGMIIKKAEHEKSLEKKEDEFPIEMFAKENSGLDKSKFGSSIVLTAREYQEYSEANGRYQGRKNEQKSILSPMELRVNINTIGGNTSGVDILNHLMDKHGITVDEVKKVAARLTREEEVSYADVLRPLGLKP